MFENVSYNYWLSALGQKQLLGDALSTSLFVSCTVLCTMKYYIGDGDTLRKIQKSEFIQNKIAV